MMEPWLIEYGLAGVLWGIFAANMQKKAHPHAAPWKTELALFLNMFGWPIGIAVAIYMLRTGKHDKYFRGG